MAVKTIIYILLVVAAAGAVALACGALRWKAETRAMHKRMEAARVPVQPARYDPQELEGLPAPVQRYFRAVLKDGQLVVVAARIEHAGTFNMSEEGDRWAPFTSVEKVVTRRPGFDWDARIRLLPGLAVFVHDAYINGEGILQAKLFGLVPLVSLRGTPEIARGELMRFCVETAWYPTALLPSQGVRWEAVDETSARFTLTDGATTVTALARFDDRHLLSSIYIPDRGRTVGTAIVPTPWECRFRGYAERGGMQIPLDGEVAWLLPSGPRPYWRGRIEKIEYRFAE